MRPEAAERFVIRRYEPRDREAVLALHRLALEDIGVLAPPGPWDEDLENVEDVYLAGRGEFLVVFDGPALIGMGGLRPHSADTGEIKRMRVDPRYQRRGIGQRILELLEARAREIGYRKLCLDTSTLQLAAQALYRTNSYVETGRGVQGRFELIFFEKVL